MATKCLSVAQVADLLGCSPAHVYELLNAGQLDCVRLGPHRKSIPEDAYEAFVKRGGVQSVRAVRRSA